MIGVARQEAHLVSMRVSKEIQLSTDMGRSFLARRARRFTRSRRASLSL